MIYFKYKHGLHGVNTRPLSLLNMYRWLEPGKLNDDIQLPRSLKNHLKFDNKQRVDTI